MSKRPAAPADAAAPEAAPVQTPAPHRPDWLADEFAGLGGDYVLDPETGRRTRVNGADLPADPAAA